MKYVLPSRPPGWTTHRLAHVSFRSNIFGKRTSRLVSFWLYHVRRNHSQIRILVNVLFLVNRYFAAIALIFPVVSIFAWGWNVCAANALSDALHWPLLETGVRDMTFRSIVYSNTFCVSQGPLLFGHFFITIMIAEAMLVIRYSFYANWIPCPDNYLQSLRHLPRKQDHTRDPFIVLGDTYRIDGVSIPPSNYV